MYKNFSLVYVNFLIPSIILILSNYLYPKNISAITKGKHTEIFNRKLNSRSTHIGNNSHSK